MIIYIHGFGGSGEGVKSRILRDIFSKEEFIAPSLSYVPELAISTLHDVISSLLKHEKIYLIGSSLGGYYATYMANYYNIPAVLINPSTKPTMTLRKVLGNTHNYFDESSFEWNENHIEMLKEYEVEDIKSELYMLLTQKGDELLDYKEGVNKFKNSKQIVEEGGCHSFDAIESKVDDMRRFFNTT